MRTITLQIHHQGYWQDALILTFDEPSRGFSSPGSFCYASEFLVNNLEQIPTILPPAISARIPLNWETCFFNQAPAFLHDIAPAGAARQFLAQRLGQEKPADTGTELFLLTRCTPAPVGNLRVKESCETLESQPSVGFSRQEIIQRNSGFLEYAYEQGAAIGGATGAGGEAPKLLMTQDNTGLLYPDAVLKDELAPEHWFIKFPRNRSSTVDKDILRSEYHYYRALNTLGIPSVASPKMSLEEADKPSLWLERFDRSVAPTAVARAAVESIYSLAQVTTPGSYLNHVDVIFLLSQLWAEVDQSDAIQSLVNEYVRRDLLNSILGNSDNHGRNTAIIRAADGLRLAPIYDLAPMVMDEEGITRTTKWPKGIEVAGQVNWLAASQALRDVADPETTYEYLRSEAKRLLALPDLLAESGLPTATFNHPAIALGNLKQRLTSRGLL